MQKNGGPEVVDYSRMVPPTRAELLMRGGGIDAELEQANFARRAAKAQLLMQARPSPGGLMQARAEADARQRVAEMMQRQNQGGGFPTRQQQQQQQQQPVGPPSPTTREAASLQAEAMQLRARSEAMQHARRQREAEEAQRRQQMQQMQQMQRAAPAADDQAAMMARVRAEAMARIQQQQQQQQNAAPQRAVRGGGVPDQDSRFGHTAVAQPPGGSSSFSISNPAHAADPRDYQRRSASNAIPQHMLDAAEHQPAAGERRMQSETMTSAPSVRAAPAPRKGGYNAVFGTETHNGVTRHVSTIADNVQQQRHGMLQSHVSKSSIAIGHSPDQPSQDADGRFASGRAILQQPGGRSSISLGHVFDGAMAGDAARSQQQTKFARRRGLPQRSDPSAAAGGESTARGRTSLFGHEGVDVAPNSKHVAGSGARTSLFGQEGVEEQLTSKQVNAPPGGRTSIALGGFYGDKESQSSQSGMATMSTRAPVAAHVAAQGGNASAEMRAYEQARAEAMARFERESAGQQQQQQQAQRGPPAAARQAQDAQFQQQQAQFAAMQQHQVEEERAHARSMAQRRSHMEQVQLERAQVRQRQAAEASSMERSMASHERAMVMPQQQPNPVRGAPGAQSAAERDAWMRAAQAQHKANAMIQGSGADRAVGGRGLRGGALAQAISFGRIADEDAGRSRRSNGSGSCSIIGRSSTRLHAPPGGKSTFALF